MNVNAAAQAEAVRQQEQMAQQQALLAQQQEVARQQAADAREQEMERRRQEYALAQAKAQEEANQVCDNIPLLFVDVCSRPLGTNFFCMLLNGSIFGIFFVRSSCAMTRRKRDDKPPSNNKRTKPPQLGPHFCNRKTGVDKKKHSVPTMHVFNNNNFQ